jgi:hypothetical protein
MSRFPSDKHFASWMGLCPGTKITGGKVMSGATKRCADRAAQALRLAAAALRTSQSALGAYFRRMCARMDKPKAVAAAARKLARLIYTMLTKGEEYTDQGHRPATRSDTANGCCASCPSVPTSSACNSSPHRRPHEKRPAHQSLEGCFLRGSTALRGQERASLDGSQFLVERFLGECCVIRGLPAQPPAVTKPEVAAEPEVSIGRDCALTSDDLADSLCRHADVLGEAVLC